VREIGNKLNVANILEGTVRRAGKKIRINVQLINTADGIMLVRNL
jgi:Predicted integral membrane protein